MVRIFFLVGILVLAGTSGLRAETPVTDDWLTWRGPSGKNLTSGPPVPTHWDDQQNILWKVPLAGRGHSSPILVGDQLVLTTADQEQQIQYVVALHKNDGRQLWKTEVSRGGFPEKTHSKNTHATPTVACNGHTLFAVFHHHDKVQLTALDLHGQIQWQVDAGPYEPARYQFGYGPSPMLHDGRIFIAAEYEKGWLAAFAQDDGRELWRAARPNTSYSSPVATTLAGVAQLLLSGDDRVTSYDPASGEVLWSVEGTTAATAGTAVWEDGVVFAASGFPESHTLAVKADGSEEVLWTKREKAYEQSMLVYRGYVYLVNDGGILFCWDAKTGEEMWKTRLGGLFSSSPIVSGDHIFVANERGKVFVFKADPKAYQQVAENSLGDETFATPIISQGKMYARYADSSAGTRQEYLVCIGAP